MTNTKSREEMAHNGHSIATGNGGAATIGPE
jgi:hypothetical protein